MKSTITLLTTIALCALGTAVSAQSKGDWKLGLGVASVSPNGGTSNTAAGPVDVDPNNRPIVTADAAALCLMAGYGVSLRSGSETLRSAGAIADALRAGLSDGGLPADAVQLVPTRDRAAVGAMLAGAGGSIDVIVPRGGRSLVERVERDARVPVFAHLEGLCHTYVARAADHQMAIDIVVNAKMRRTGICGATETLLIDAPVAETLLPAIASTLIDAGCSLRGDDAAREIVPEM